MVYRVSVNVPAYIDVVAEDKEGAIARAAALIDVHGMNALTMGKIYSDNVIIEKVEEE